MVLYCFITVILNVIVVLIYCHLNDKHSTRVQFKRNKYILILIQPKFIHVFMKSSTYIVLEFCRKIKRTCIKFNFKSAKDTGKKCRIIRVKNNYSHNRSSDFYFLKHLDLLNGTTRTHQLSFYRPPVMVNPTTISLVSGSVP